MIVEILGLSELNARLVKIANGSMDAMKKGAMKTMLRVEREAKQLVPTSPHGGLLKTSIHVGMLSDGAYASAGGGGGLNDIKYAVYVEYGTGIYAKNGNGRQTPWTYFDGKNFWRTHGQKPQPYFTPAVEQAMGFAEADMKEAVDKLIGAT